MIEKMIKYVPWALAQHLFVLTLFSIAQGIVGLALSPWWAIGFFTILHVPNLPLMILTFTVALIFYPVILSGNLWWIVGLVIVHAVTGGFIKFYGLEMRVLWKHPLFRK